ncbi:glycosyltransferase family 4 protein [Paenibacillus anseongensis]|nr:MULTISPECIES: glycosyltransferase family 4 protein [Paenibacillus]
MNEINLPDFNKFIFRYTILELNTAVKPWMFSWLFNEKNYDHVFYIDPDIYLYDRLAEVEEALIEGNLMVLTPHLTGFLNDDKKPSEQNILQAGTYNLGFLAVSKQKETNIFLNWWKSKLEFDCTVDIANGLFVDQKWMDLVPGFFPRVKILHHPGYNVAYWNLNHRNVKYINDSYHVNEERLVFFHFSGVNPSNPSSLSKHQDRLTLKNIGDAAALVKRYADDVLKNDHENTKMMKYYYANFSDGISINDFVRISYRNNEEIQKHCGQNPFIQSGYFLTTQARFEDRSSKLPLITHIMYSLWLSRKDLQSVFSDIWNKDRMMFCQWFVDSAQREYNFTEAYTEPVLKSLVQLDSRTVITEKEVQPIITNNTKAYVSRKLYHTALRLKPLILKVAPKSSKNKLKMIKEKLQKNAYSASTIVSTESAPAKVESPQFIQGINLIGYSRSQTGVGESCRLAARALDNYGLPFGVLNYNVGNPASNTDITWINKEIEKPIYNVNILHINADQIPIAFDYLGNEVFSGKYNIGYWHWELPDFPDEWKSSFQYLNEIWVPSRFIMDSVSKKSPIPVVRIPHGIQVTIQEQISREEFNLPSNTFLFLTMYDVYSFQERKNPNAVIEAFKKSFSGDNISAGLVIKVNHSSNNQDEVQQLQELIKGYDNIYLVAETMSRDRVNSLINCCDCFISLHRSEGFGLGLAEAMYLGKAVIGTNWSANTDFMTEKNSCVVDYKLVQLGQDYGPYKSYQHWADPDIDHASYFMKKLVGDENFYRDISKKGEFTIKTEFSPKAVGKQVKERLQHLGLY